MLSLGSVSRHNPQAAFSTYKGSILSDYKSPCIEDHVAVGAQAKNILWFVRPVMRSTQRTDVSTLCICPTGSL